MHKAVSALFSFYNWLIIRLCSGHVSSTADMFILLIKIKFKVKNVVTEPQMRVCGYDVNPFSVRDSPIIRVEAFLLRNGKTRFVRLSHNWLPIFRAAYKWGDVVTRDPPIK